MKSLLIKTSITYLKQSVGAGVLCSLQNKYDNNLDSANCKLLGIHKQVENNNFIANNRLPHKIAGIQTYGKNQFGFLLENLHIHWGKLKEIEQSIG